LLHILYAGDTWKGASSRALREALDSIASVRLDEVDTDHFMPPYRSTVMRAASRLLHRFQVAELERDIAFRMQTARPHALVVYKGYGVGKAIVRRAQALGILAVNVFPDCSPHAFGGELRDAIGAYDLVISTKPFHPTAWNRIYGYTNRCVCVPHGYHPSVHHWPDAPRRKSVDVVMAATWREEYHALMRRFAAETIGDGFTVAVAGAGWEQRRHEFPAAWQFVGALAGRSYGEFLRSGRIAIAPVQRTLVVDGICHPGDEDSIRTYELAAAGCFFLHQRTEYVRTVYDERCEVPLWADARELAALVRHYLPMEDVCRSMAAAAQARAVPGYSIDSRALDVVNHIHQALATRRTAVAALANV
jgi:hypothetical protein